MPWLEVEDDCHKAEDVMRKVAEWHKRHKAGMAKPEMKAPPPPPPAPKPRKPQLQMKPLAMPQAPGKLQKIIVETSRYFDVKISVMLSDSRESNLVHYRNVAMYLCRKLTRATYPEIGRKFDKDHTTVLHSVGIVMAALHLGTDEELAKAVNEIEKNLGVAGEGTGHLPKVGRYMLAARYLRPYYSRKEIQQIKHLIAQGKNATEIARILERSVAGIRTKLNRICAEEAGA